MYQRYTFWNEHKRNKVEPCIGDVNSKPFQLEDIENMDNNYRSRVNNINRNVSISVICNGTGVYSSDIPQYKDEVLNIPQHKDHAASVMANESHSYSILADDTAPIPPFNRSLPTYGSLHSTTTDITVTPPIKIFRRRWLMLSLFCTYAFINAYQWIHLNIVSDRVESYWIKGLPTDVYQRRLVIDWLSMIYMLVYIPLILPVAWLLDTKGLKPVAVIATLLNAIGACLKCATLASDRFWLLMVAQFICAVAQVFLLSIPPILSAVWFGAKEVSTATAIGVFGNQVGVAFGFAIPPLVVPTSQDMQAVERGFSYLFYPAAAASVAIFILVVLLMKEKPPLPPSQGQLAICQSSKKEYAHSLRKLATNRGFVLLTVSYGINTGCYYAISTLLNVVMLNYYQNQESLIGWTGFVMVIAGVIGSILAGFILDASHEYKLTTLMVYLFSMLLMAFFTGMFFWNMIWIAFVACFLLGFFMTGYLPIGFEFAAELTYPENEGLSSGILNASAQIFGIILTLGMGALITNVNVLAANCTLTGILFVGLILTAIIPSDLRRTKANNKINQETENSFNSEIIIAKDSSI